MIETVMLTHAAAAAAYAALSALILVRARLSSTGWLLAGAAAITALWAGSVALSPQTPFTGVSGVLDLARSAGWYVFILHLYRRTVRARGQLSQAFAMMGFVALLVIGVILLLEPGGQAGVSLLSAGTAARLGLAVCNILLIENLYQNVPDEAKWYINLPCIALGGLFVFDIVLSADAVLFRQTSANLLAGRAIATVIVAPLLAMAAARNRDWKIDIHVSRNAVFHSATLVVAGVFLLGLSAVGEAFRYLGAGWSGVAEISLVFAGLITTAVLLTSGTARSRLRRLVVDNFFSSRFDYRREWLRCIATLSAADADAKLPTRVIRAVADVVDSPGGILYLRPAGAAPDAPFHWAGAASLPSDGMPVPAAAPLVAALRGGSWIVALDAASRPAGVPPDAWLAVPLPLPGSVAATPDNPDTAANDTPAAPALLGFILLAPPRAPFRLDREVFELLRILGREVATYVAEQRATEVMLQGRQLAEYGKRFAFVAHDIKNVSSQLSLLLSNAERHMSNPEFQRDMLTTVRASVQKITALLRRLEAPEPAPPPATLAPVERLGELLQTLARPDGPKLALEYDRTGVGVAIAAAAFDAVVTHLVSNALDATLARPGAQREPVRVVVGHDGRHVLVDIIDRGVGMAADFVRDTLFRPFGTAKRGGTGIGAFQARELLREAGGDLVVTSRPGEGTTMRLVLPAAAQAVAAPV
ncbi:MAG: PEP-CTERM system histidine kinase PrsK [Acetobacteraceae bacterium]|nr:PEP-CTERM system histidine kinase PrsK [Acetobacteraceae bacterium]